MGARFDFAALDDDIEAQLSATGAIPSVQRGNAWGEFMSQMFSEAPQLVSIDDLGEYQERLHNMGYLPKFTKGVFDNLTSGAAYNHNSDLAHHRISGGKGGLHATPKEGFEFLVSQFPEGIAKAAHAFGKSFLGTLKRIGTLDLPGIRKHWTEDLLNVISVLAMYPGIAAMGRTAAGLGAAAKVEGGIMGARFGTMGLAATETALTRGEMGLFTKGVGGMTKWFSESSSKTFYDIMGRYGARAQGMRPGVAAANELWGAAKSATLIPRAVSVFEPHSAYGKDYHSGAVRLPGPHIPGLGTPLDLPFIFMAPVKPGAPTHLAKLATKLPKGNANPYWLAGYRNTPGYDKVRWDYVETYTRAIADDLVAQKGSKGTFGAMEHLVEQAQRGGAFAKTARDEAMAEARKMLKDPETGMIRPEAEAAAFSYAAENPRAVVAYLRDVRFSTAQDAAHGVVSRDWETFSNKAEARRLEIENMLHDPEYLGIRDELRGIEEEIKTIRRAAGGRKAHVTRIENKLKEAKSDVTKEVLSQEVKAAREAAYGKDASERLAELERKAGSLRDKARTVEGIGDLNDAVSAVHELPETMLAEARATYKELKGQVENAQKRMQATEKLRDKILDRYRRGELTKPEFDDAMATIKQRLDDTRTDYAVLAGQRADAQHEANSLADWLKNTKGGPERPKGTLGLAGTKRRLMLMRENFPAHRQAVKETLDEWMAGGGGVRDRLDTKLRLLGLGNVPDKHIEEHLRELLRGASIDITHLFPAAEQRSIKELGYRYVLGGENGLFPTDFVGSGPGMPRWDRLTTFSKFFGWASTKPVNDLDIVRAAHATLRESWDDILVERFPDVFKYGDGTRLYRHLRDNLQAQRDALEASAKEGGKYSRFLDRLRYAVHPTPLQATDRMIESAMVKEFGIEVAGDLAPEVSKTLQKAALEAWATPGLPWSPERSYGFLRRLSVATSTHGLPGITEMLRAFAVDDVSRAITHATTKYFPEMEKHRPLTVPKVGEKLYINRMLNGYRHMRFGLNLMHHARVATKSLGFQAFEEEVLPSFMVKNWMQKGPIKELPALQGGTRQTQADSIIIPGLSHQADFMDDWERSVVVSNNLLGFNKLAQAEKLKLQMYAKHYPAKLREVAMREGLSADEIHAIASREGEMTHEFAPTVQEYTGQENLDPTLLSEARERLPRMEPGVPHPGEAPVPPKATEANIEWRDDTVAEFEETMNQAVPAIDAAAEADEIVPVVIGDGDFQVAVRAPAPKGDEGPVVAHVRGADAEDAEWRASELQERLNDELVGKAPKKPGPDDDDMLPAYNEAMERRQFGYRADAEAISMREGPEWTEYDKASDTYAFRKQMYEEKLAIHQRQYPEGAPTAPSKAPEDDRISRGMDEGRLEREFDVMTEQHPGEGSGVFEVPPRPSPPGGDVFPGTEHRFFYRTDGRVDGELQVFIPEDGLPEVGITVRPSKQRKGIAKELVSHARKTLGKDLSDEEFAQIVAAQTSYTPQGMSFAERLTEAKTLGPDQARALIKEAHDQTVAYIRENIHGVMNYKDRSPLNRSINYVVFPFSFERKLIGAAYDFFESAPARSYFAWQVVQQVDTLNRMDENHKTAFRKVIERYAPLFRQVNRLNAFAHGLSLGEFVIDPNETDLRRTLGAAFGAVYRPLAESLAHPTEVIQGALMPVAVPGQHMKEFRDLTARLMPAWNTIAQIVNDSSEQGRVFFSKQHSAAEYQIDQYLTEYRGAEDYYAELGAQFGALPNIDSFMRQGTVPIVLKTAWLEEQRRLAEEFPEGARFRTRFVSQPAKDLEKLEIMGKVNKSRAEQGIILLEGKWNMVQNLGLENNPQGALLQKQFEKQAMTELALRLLATLEGRDREEFNDLWNRYYKRLYGPIAEEASEEYSGEEA